MDDNGGSTGSRVAGGTFDPSPSSAFRRLPPANSSGAASSVAVRRPDGETGASGIGSGPNITVPVAGKRKVSAQDNSTLTLEELNAIDWYDQACLVTVFPCHTQRGTDDVPVQYLFFEGQDVRKRECAVRYWRRLTARQQQSKMKEYTEEAAMAAAKAGKASARTRRAGSRGRASDRRTKQEVASQQKAAKAMAKAQKAARKQEQQEQRATKKASWVFAVCSCLSVPRTRLWLSSRVLSRHVGSNGQDYRGG